MNATVIDFQIVSALSPETLPIMQGFKVLLLHAAHDIFLVNGLTHAGRTHLSPGNFSAAMSKSSMPAETAAGRVGVWSARLLHAAIEGCAYVCTVPGARWQQASSAALQERQARGEWPNTAQRYL